MVDEVVAGWNLTAADMVFMHSTLLVMSPMRVDVDEVVLLRSIIL